jgi:thioesterase domain-containing protein
MQLNSKITNEEILKEFINKHFPALVLIGAEVVSASQNEVVISAPMDKNHNDKGTAFGASQYMLCIAASWGLAYINAKAAGLKQPNILIAEGNIKYLKPIHADNIITRATAEPKNMDAFRNAIQNNQKATLIQETIVEGKDVIKSSEFQARYVLFPE